MLRTTGMMFVFRMCFHSSSVEVSLANMMVEVEKSETLALDAEVVIHKMVKNVMTSTDFVIAFSFDQV